jgi:hypothetical protein
VYFARGKKMESSRKVGKKYSPRTQGNFPAGENINWFYFAEGEKKGNCFFYRIYNFLFAMLCREGLGQ